MSAINRISMRQFGKMGRFANQIFQRMFVLTYAKMHALHPELPQWVGCDFFGNDDPPIEGPMLYQRIEGKDADGQPPIPAENEFVNRDFIGWGQVHTSWYRPHADWLIEQFQPSPKTKERLDPIAEKFNGRFVIGLHFRRGDYGAGGTFWITPLEWYYNAMKGLKNKFGDPLFFISTEDRSVISALAEFKPVTAETLGVTRNTMPLEHYQYLPHDLRQKDPAQLDFFPDWYLLSKCNFIVGPNSTFSYAAAMIGRPEYYYRATLSRANFVRVDPWNDVPLNREKAEDYPHIEGTLTASNPYWR